MDSGLKTLYQRIAAAGRRFGARRVVLYGSRARGDERARSDIDLAVFGMPESSHLAFREALGELPTLLAFDLVFVTSRTDAALLHNIQKDGVILMDKFQEKYEKLTLAVSRLEESIEDYEAVHLDSVRDGVIQRFEFCTELAWKTVREYLLAQGYQDVNSPKSVMKQAYADGLLLEEQGWLELLNARNMTSHLYDEAASASVFQAIVTRYCPLFRQLTAALQEP